MNSTHEQWKLELQNLKLFSSPNEKLFKLRPWCCYIGSQPQSLQIYFESKPLNKIKSGQDKIIFDEIKSGQNKI